MQKRSKIDETSYIIGIDLGQQSAMISYLDHKTQKPVIYDLSGGYGDVAIPILLQYIAAEKQWLIGSDAQLNAYQEGTVTVHNLMDGLLSITPIQIEDMLVPPSQLLTIFIHKIMESFNHLNPNARIISMAIAVEDYAYEVVAGLVLEAVKPNTHIKIRVYRASLSVLTYLNLCEIPYGEQFRILEYGYNALRSIKVVTQGNQVTLSLEENTSDICVKAIESVLRNEITSMYMNHLNLSEISILDQCNIEQIFDQCFMTIFQRFAKKQDIKLYYSFAFPPFQKILAYKRVIELMEPFIEAFNAYISRLEDQEVPVLMLGQGFKMLWPQTQLKMQAKIIEANPYEIIAKGSALLAGSELLAIENLKVSVQEKVVKSYGLRIGDSEEDFLPLDENTQMFILDFEEEESVMLYLISQDLNKAIITEAELELKKENALDNKMRLCVKVTPSQEQKVTLDVEVLKM